MNLWDRHLLKRFSHAFLYVFFICTALSFFVDFGLKWKLIRELQIPILEYYSYRFYPYLLLSLPMITFISIHLCFKRLIASKEMSLAHLYSRTGFRSLRILFFALLFLCALWLSIREIAWPKQILSEPNWSQELSQKPFVYSSQKGTLWIQAMRSDPFHYKYGIFAYNDKQSTNIIQFEELIWRKGTWSIPKEESLKGSSILKDMTAELPHPMTFMEIRGELNAWSLFQIWQSDLSQIKKIAYAFQRFGLPFLFLILSTWLCFRIYQNQETSVPWSSAAFAVLIFCLALSESFIH